MKFKVIAIYLLSLMTISTLNAQTLKKGTTLYSFSAGASFANLTNSKAPHNIYLIGSDIYPVVTTPGGLSSSTLYFDYQPEFFRDMKAGIFLAGDWEHFIKDNLSINGAIAFETKGIDVAYNNEIVVDNDNFPASTFTEVHHRKISNQYLTLSFAAKKYFQHQVYIEGGVYGSKLITSMIDLYSEKSFHEGPGNYFESMIEISGKDDGGEFTAAYDLGITAGFGFQKFISEKIFLKSGVRVNAGLIKVDGKYNNEYEESYWPQSSNIIATTVRSTNYYGFNSNARNINILFLFGVGWVIK